MPEIEAKFLLHRPSELRSVLTMIEKLGYSVHEGATESIADRYYDTADWALYRAGWSCRWRRNAERRTLTLKALEGGAGPVFVREEIEQTLPEDHDPAHAMPQGPAVARLAELIDDAERRELFRVLNERTSYRVERVEAPAVALELAYDRTRIIAGNTGHDGVGFTELELELKQGPAAALEATADELHRRLGLATAHMSKFERGLEVAGLAPARRTVTPLTRQDRLLDLAYEHFARRLDELERLRPFASEGLDPEHVHRMRIAIRRIRALLRLLPQIVADAGRFNGEFRWLGRALGRSRDATVHCDAIRRIAAQMPDVDAAALAAYDEHLAEESKRAQRELVAALSGERCGRLLADFRTVLDAGPQLAVVRRFGDVGIGAAADELCRQVVRKLLKHGRRISDRSAPSELHALRIRVKRTRYALECFRPYDVDRLKRPLKALCRLQDVLGEYQDTFPAAERLSHHAESLPLMAGRRRELIALGALLQLESERRRAARVRFAAAWKRVVRSSRGFER